MILSMHARALALASLALVLGCGGSEPSPLSKVVGQPRASAITTVQEALKADSKLAKAATYIQVWGDPVACFQINSDETTMKQSGFATPEEFLAACGVNTAAGNRVPASDTRSPDTRYYLIPKDGPGASVEIRMHNSPKDGQKTLWWLSVIQGDIVRLIQPHGTSAFEPNLKSLRELLDSSPRKALATVGSLQKFVSSANLGVKHFSGVEYRAEADTPKGIGLALVWMDAKGELQMDRPSPMHVEARVPKTDAPSLAKAANGLGFEGKLTLGKPGEWSAFAPLEGATNADGLQVEAFVGDSDYVFKVTKA